MAQEQTALTTNNSTGGLFGGFFTGLGNLIKEAAPAAANYYTLKLQGDTLKEQNSAPVMPAPVPAPAGASTLFPAWVKPWMLWTGIAVAVVTLIALIRGRR